MTSALPFLRLKMRKHSTLVVELSKLLEPKTENECLSFAEMVQKVIDVGLGKHVSKQNLGPSGKVQSVFIERQSLGIHTYNIRHVNRQLRLPHLVYPGLSARCNSNLDERQGRQAEIRPEVLNQLLHFSFVPLGRLGGESVALPLKPQHRPNLTPSASASASGGHRLLRPPYHVLVERLPLPPQVDLRAADCAGDETDGGGGGGAEVGEEGAGEGKAGADAAGLGGVDVGVERGGGGLPEGGGGEAEDGGVGVAFLGDLSVPFAVSDAAAAGHVALSGEYEDLLLSFF